MALGHGADVITASVLKKMEMDGVPIEKLASIATDGAGPMLGCKSGFAARVCSRNKTCLAMHYVCHQEALVCKDAAMAIPYLALL